MNGFRIAWFPILLLGGACGPLSEEVQNPTAGMNGGFEHVQAGLPVNWIVYSPATIPSGRYQLLFDTADFKEGLQSLRFRVEECSASGGWRSPGITQEFEARSGTDYSISFWIKSQDSEWKVSYGGVTAKTGAYETVTSTDVPAGEWHHVERIYRVPAQFDRLRFELSITSPGNVWIDDFEIEPVTQER